MRLFSCFSIQSPFESTCLYYYALVEYPPLVKKSNNSDRTSEIELNIQE